MSTTIDPQMALSAAAQQDINAQRQRVESLSRSENPQEKRARLEDACESFEAVFIQKMWEQMRASLPKDGLMQGKEEKYWQSMYDQELGKSMASVGGIGLADMMMKQLVRNDESMNDAAKNTAESSMRRPGLQVSPAPLLPDSASVERRTAREHAAGKTSATPAAQAQPAQSEQTSLTAQTAQLGQASTSIYDGEAAFAAPTPGDEDVMAQNAGHVNGQAMGQVNGQANAPVAAQANTIAVSADTPPNVRQLLDELAQQQGATVVTEAPQNPQVVRHTYQTNLPPSERKAELLRNGGTRSLNTQPTGQTYAPSSEVVAGYSAMTPQNTPGAQAAAPLIPATLTVAENIPVSPERTDILSGIQPRFLPTRFQNRPDELGRDALGIHSRTRPNSGSNAMPGTAFAALDNDAFSSNMPPYASGLHAGGPVLDAPETVVNPVALGNPEPPRGSMVAPASGELSSAFGWRLDPFTGQRSWHTGVDIKAQPGEGVLAAMNGVVTFAGTHPELGNLVVMDHGDGLRTFYGHNQSLDVSVGQQVNAGTELARAGSSGRAAGSHVHFEVRRGELALNPEPLLRQRNLQVAEAR